jgi:hypothetical protein
MFFRIFFLLTITSWFQINCYVPVPLIYRNVELALRRYSSSIDYNPVIYSLLNVLIYDKRAKAFIINEAIEQSLEAVKKFDENDEAIMRQVILSTQTPTKSDELSDDVKEEIHSALDTFFANQDIDDDQTFDVLSDKEKRYV